MAHVEKLPARPLRRTGRSFSAAARSRVSGRTLRLVVWLAALALGALFALGLASNDLLLGSPDSLGQVDPFLLVAAILAEALSLGAYGLMVKRLLAHVGIVTTVRPLLGTTLAGVALASSIPAGAAASAVYWYRALRGYGANRGQATHVLIVITLVSIASLAGLVALGAGLAEMDAVPGTVRAAVLVGVVVLGAGLATRPWARSSYHLGVAGLASINWLVDCLALYVSLRAVGADVPLRALIATYAVAQIVAVIPLLPGGGGTVEASLVLGFAAFGHTSGSVVAGVVLYRLISNWALVPIGWAAIALQARRRSPRLGRSVVAARPLREDAEPLQSL